ASSGSFELYHVAGGGVLSGSPVAPIGNNFQVKEFGNFSNSSQMMMQDNTHDASAGQLELYNYNPSIRFFSCPNFGGVGDNVNFNGCANLFGNGATQMVMQQNNGTFWLYTYDPSIDALSGIPVGAGRQQLPRCRLWRARQGGPGRNVDAGCQREFRS